MVAMRNMIGHYPNDPMKLTFYSVQSVQSTIGSVSFYSIRVYSVQLDSNCEVCSEMLIHSNTRYLNS